MKPDAPVNTQSAVYQAILEEEAKSKGTAINQEFTPYAETLRQSSTSPVGLSQSFRKLKCTLDGPEGKFRCRESSCSYLEYKKCSAIHEKRKRFIRRAVTAAVSVAAVIPFASGRFHTHSHVNNRVQINSSGARKEQTFYFMRRIELSCTRASSSLLSVNKRDDTCTLLICIRNHLVSLSLFRDRSVSGASKSSIIDNRRRRDEFTFTENRFPSALSRLSNRTCDETR